MLIRWFEWMERRSAVLLATGVFVGLISQDLAALCKPFLGASVFVLFLATVLRLEWSELAWRFRRPARPILVLAGAMIGAPLVMTGAIDLFAPPEFLRTPLVLIASSPPLISVPAFALLLGLDAPLALVVMVAGFALQPVLQPPVALALLGIKLDISLAALMLRLAEFIGGAFVGAWALRWIAGDVRIRRHRSALGGIAVLMLLVFAIGVMDGLRAEFIDDPGHVLTCVAAVFLTNFGLQAVGAAVFWGAAPALRLTGREGLTAALVLGNRNLATLIAVLGSAASKDVFLMLAAYQFPMYMIPAVAGPAYRALLKIRQ
jgi:BASS family bile acid:Na+ symporter